MGNAVWPWIFLLFSFDGRINRAKYWVGMLVVGLSAMLLVAILIWMSSLMSSGAGDLLLIGTLAIYVVATWPWLALNIKRWHDRDKSGVWVLIAFIPFIGAIWALVETGFMLGTVGPNKYGADPLS